MKIDRANVGHTCSRYGALAVLLLCQCTGADHAAAGTPSADASSPISGDASPEAPAGDASSAAPTLEAGALDANDEATPLDASEVDSYAVEYPNEPPGAMELTNDPFDSTAADGWTVNDGSENISIVQDNSAPWSPPNVLQITYPTGLAGGNTPLAMSHPISGGYQEFYASIWLKYSTGFVFDDAEILKIMYVWASDETPTLCLCTVNASPSPALTGNFIPEIRTQDAEEDDLGPNVAGQTGYSFPPNQWVRLEFSLKMNTPSGVDGGLGNKDGVFKIWAQGVEVADYPNVRIVNGPTQETWVTMQIAPYWGGGGGTVSAPQELWVDHVYASAR
jgi:hypothetical protein